MTIHSLSGIFHSGAWEVFLLFLIPIGAGIPGGVVLAQKYSIGWPIQMLLYFFSDVVLAFCFEALLLFFVTLSERSKRLSTFREAFGKAMSKTVAKYGLRPNPFSLVMITFGTDPMTGRSAAFAAGHGFISGWTLVIIGDMLFFTLLMASTIWLNHFLGDGTLTAVIITLVVIGAPPLWRRIRPLK